MRGLVRPTAEDPLATSASECIGGPAGEHSAPHPWWSPLRVVLAVTCVALCLGMLAKTPCVQESWGGGDARYQQMCYSDVPYLYVGRGFAERILPYSDTGGRYQAMEYPVVIGYFAYGAALITQALDGWPDLGPRQSVPADKVYAAPGVSREMGLYFDVTAVLLAGCALAAAWFLARTQRRRPWDAMLFAAAPVLVLSGLINWDLIAVAASAAAMWAWARGRPALSGVFIGLGVATKLYPVFLLGALLVVCLRRRDLRPFLVGAGAAAATWLLVDAPAMLYGFDQWKQFWVLNEQRGADLGSLWLVWQQMGHTVSVGLVNTTAAVFFAAVCLTVLGLGLSARRAPRVPQLVFLVLVGFLVVNKVYSPQYVLWLLPFAVLARPRWRDILVWQAGEAFYFVAVWLYLGHSTAPSGTGAPDEVYWLAIIVRVLAELYLAALVVRDVVAPWHDPVRRDGVTDDPVYPSGEEGVHMRYASSHHGSPVR